jgi:integrase
MRLPHYLVRNPSGRFVFRLRVPRALQALTNRSVIKHALCTTDARLAQQQALGLAARYAQIFEQLGWHGMPKAPKPDDVLASVQANGLSRYELDLQSGRLKVDGPEDHALAMDALARIGSVGFLARRAEPAAPPAPKVAEAVSMKQAKDAWVKSLASSTTKKTLSIKSAAIDGLVRFVGEKRQLHTLTRSDLARWYQHLRDEKISTPTLTNKQSYIGGKHGFFAWAMASGHYPAGDNPAAGHVSYTANEKRKRRKFGFKAFTAEEIATLFAPENFAKLSFHARWACLIGLYTGARVAEVGQLRVLDIIEIDGIPCFNFTDEGEGQSLKSEPSKRVVPIHPELIRLGFLDHVQSLVKANESQLFPKGKIDAINGRGNWITKAFGNYLKKVGGQWPPAKRGFHSLRKSVIQELQGKGVASEMRAQIVGHELDDEHHAIYSREFTPGEKLSGVRSKTFSSPGLSTIDFRLPNLRESIAKFANGA